MGCQVYEPRPLNPSAIVAEVDRARREPVDEGMADSKDAGGMSLGQDADTGVTLAQAARWMRDRGPDIREAIAAYRTALARARVPTPWPNPGLEVGPEFGFGDAVSSRRVVPFGSIGIVVPLGGRVARADDLNAVRAEVARIDGEVRCREAYLTLRRRWVRLVSARTLLLARDGLLEAATRGVTSVRRLVEAGQGTALDVALFDLERGRTEGERITAAAAVGAAEADLGALVGVHEGQFERLHGDALPELADGPADLDALKQLLVAHHGGLARLRVRYEEAEAVLRLEIAKQVPDLRIGPSFAGESGEEKTTLGLALGIELPFFDRNQQAIAEAEARREEVRTQYEAEANRALAQIERARRAVEFARSRSLALRTSVLPSAESSIALARESAQAGAGDALRLLDAQRSHRQVLIDVERAALDELEAWIDLEEAVGHPLLAFPSSPHDEGERVPDGLSAPSRAREGETDREGER
jgi:outer membrane protein TolC